MRRRSEKDARTYSFTLKDYRSIQVKMLQTLAKLGVKNSEDDLARLLSDLPEIRCDVKNCPCAYHQSIKRILEVAT